MMAAGPLPANEIRLAGWVSRHPQTRRSGTGIPVARFVLEHRSRRETASGAQDVQLEAVVICAGEELAGQVRQLRTGTPIHVEGFLRGLGAGGRVQISARRLLTLPVGQAQSLPPTF